MKITCPSCNTSYSVDAATFPGEGRSVRCARCKNVWHAVPYVPDADILPPPETVGTGGVPVKPDGGASAQGADQHKAIERRPEAETPRARIVDDGSGEISAAGEAEGQVGVEQAAEVRARAAAKRAKKGPTIRIRNSGHRGIDAFFVGAFLAIAFASVHYREDVVRSLPGTASLYELVGMPVNLRGLEFVGIGQRRDFEDGVPVLIVEGTVHNVKDRTLPVPALRFALRGKEGDEIYSWTIEPRQRVIEADATMNFRTRLASPPRGADDVMIRFTQRSNRIVEYSN